jgi:Reverse transcriptase (RNA-dependent DNA polymerase)
LTSDYFTAQYGSSAFDTVDHDILLSVLERRFGVDGIALRWFRSYLEDRTQVFVVNGNSSTTHRVGCSVPQGSVLGPLGFISYTHDVTLVFKRHNIKNHLFADDKQAYTSAPLHGVDDVRDRLHDCTTDISNWCASRRLQLNEDKTELAWFGKRSRLVQLASIEQTVTVGASVIQPSSVVRDVGGLLDQELSMTQHIARVTSSCFYQLRRFRQICRLVGQELVSQLVQSFVLSRLDYGNSVLAGLPKSAIVPLQRVQNAAARLILDLRMNEHGHQLCRNSTGCPSISELTINCAL